MIVNHFCVRVTTATYVIKIKSNIKCFTRIKFYVDKSIKLLRFDVVSD